MVYAIKKKINGISYYYAVISVRVGSKVKLKTLKFLGKEDDLSRNQVKKFLKQIPQKDIDKAKAEVKAAAGIKPKKPVKKKEQKKQKEKPRQASKKDILNIMKQKKITLDDLKKAFK